MNRQSLIQALANRILKEGQFGYCWWEDPRQQPEGTLKNLIESWGVEVKNAKHARVLIEKMGLQIYKGKVYGDAVVFNQRITIT